MVDGIEKLTVALLCWTRNCQLYVTRRYITVFTKDLHILSLHSLISILILYSYLTFLYTFLVNLMRATCSANPFFFFKFNRRKILRLEYILDIKSVFTFHHIYDVSN
jgi:hypothetical protein